MACQQGQSTGLGNLNHCRLAAEQIGGSNRAQQRIGHSHFHLLAARRTAESLHKTLAAVADSHLHHLGIGTDTPDALCRSAVGFCGAEAPLE